MISSLDTLRLFFYFSCMMLAQDIYFFTTVEDLCIDEEDRTNV